MRASFISVLQAPRLLGLQTVYIFRGFRQIWPAECTTCCEDFHAPDASDLRVRADQATTFTHTSRSPAKQHMNTHKIPNPMASQVPSCERGRHRGSAGDTGSRAPGLLRCRRLNQALSGLTLIVLLAHLALEGGAILQSMCPPK